MFYAIEESRRGGVALGQEVRSEGQKQKNSRELRKSECSINYDRDKGGEGGVGRKSHGTQLLLSCS